APQPGDREPGALHVRALDETDVAAASIADQENRDSTDQIPLVGLDVLLFERPLRPEVGCAREGWHAGEGDLLGAKLTGRHPLELLVNPLAQIDGHLEGLLHALVLDVPVRIEELQEPGRDALDRRLVADGGAFERGVIPNGLDERELTAEAAEDLAEVVTQKAHAVGEHVIADLRQLPAREEAVHAIADGRVGELLRKRLEEVQVAAAGRTVRAEIEVAREHEAAVRHERAAAPRDRSGLHSR